jgi:hypothetical protein
MGVPTIDTIDLNQELLNRALGGASGIPGQVCRVGSNSRETDIWRWRDIKSKNIDKLGYWFPESLKGAMKQPRRTGTTDVSLVDE